MNTTTMQFIDDVYYKYLKQLFVAAPAKEHLTENEQAMLNGYLTLDECFLKEKLCNA
jgi:hypothetical protein